MGILKRKRFCGGHIPSKRILKRWIVQSDANYLKNLLSFDTNNFWQLAFWIKQNRQIIHEEHNPCFTDDRSTSTNPSFPYAMSNLQMGNNSYFVNSIFSHQSFIVSQLREDAFFLIIKSNLHFTKTMQIYWKGTFFHVGFSQKS